MGKMKCKTCKFYDSTSFFSVEGGSVIEQRQTEAMGKLDTFKLTYEYYDNEGVQYTGYYDTPDYLTPPEGHGHIQRVIDGMNTAHIELYTEALCDAVQTDYGVPDLTYECVGRLHKATCQQKVDAIMKAHGVWED